MRALKFIGQMILFLAGYVLLNIIINFANMILNTYQDFFAWVACIVMVGAPVAIIVWLMRGENN